MYAMNGRYLHIDLNRVESTAYPIPESVYHSLIGGTGLASWLLFHWCPPRADPLSPEAPLVFATNPFTGTGVTTASKIAVAARSPQTGMIGDSLSSSYLAITLKRTGFDGLVITGKAQDWSTLIVQDNRITIQDSRDLLGMSTVDTSDRVRKHLGKSFRVAAIGPAGENLVRYAAISNDGRLAGRTGTGAVMGSKRLKSIAINGSKRLPAVADPTTVARIARDLAQRSLGPATSKYRELGTAANLALFNRLSMLPTQNFQANSAHSLDALSGESLTETHRTDKNACAACTIGCEHHYQLRDGSRSVRLEYESLYALGPLCGVNDPDIVLDASALCDDHGIDSITTGATIAWAMECRDRAVDLGIPIEEMPQFGDGASLVRSIEQIARREGIGNLLAEGSRRAAELTGQNSADWALHVKGLELPGYDPRKLPTLALGLAVATRGACHNRSSAYEVDLSPEADPTAEAQARAAAAIAAEDRAAVLDALTICKFLRHCFEDFEHESAELLTAVTGHPFTATDITRAGARINDLKKLFNIKQGWTRDDDWLPPRVIDAGPGPLSAEHLRQAIDSYYEQRGWDQAGMLSDAGQHELPLEVTSISKT